MIIRFLITKRHDIDLYALYYGLGEHGFRQVVEDSLKSFLLNKKQKHIPEIDPVFPEPIPDKIEIKFTMRDKNVEKRLDSVKSGMRSQFIRNILRYYGLNRTGYIYFENGFGESSDEKEGLTKSVDISEYPDTIKIVPMTQPETVKTADNKTDTKEKFKNSGTKKEDDVIIQKDRISHSSNEEAETVEEDKTGDDLDKLMNMFGDDI